MRKARFYLIISTGVAAGLMAFLSACSQAPAPNANTKEYQATGEILALDPAAQTAKVRANKIEGWMDAMTMEFPVKDTQEFKKLRIGETIHAEVVVEGTDYWLSGIKEGPGEEPAK